MRRTRTLTLALIAVVLASTFGASRMRAQQPPTWRPIRQGPQRILSVAVAAALVPPVVASADFCNTGTTYPTGPLAQIQILVGTAQGSRAAAWYHNSYFAGNPNLLSFDRFYPGTGIPVSPTPSGYQVPGWFGPAVGAYGMLMALSEIRCSSRYGGSIELRFKPLEDLQYEIGDSTYLWDLANPVLRIYVQPTAPRFNYPTTSSSIHAAFDAGRSVRYLRAGQWPAPVPPGQPDAELTAALQALAAGVEVANTPFGTAPSTNAANFVYGFIHAQLGYLFVNPNILVDAVSVSDNQLALVTRAGVRVVAMTVRVNGIDVNTEPGGEEFELSLLSGAFHEAVHAIELDQNEASRWYDFGSFPEGTCQSRQIYLGFDLLERDETALFGGSSIFDQNDHFRAYPVYFTISCAAVQQAAANSVAEEVRADDIEVYEYDSNTLRGHMSASLRVSVYLR